MNREDFTILNDSKMVYFDNGATTLKPYLVKSIIDKYYTEYCNRQVKDKQL